jgi:hypothetical protein
MNRPVQRDAETEQGGFIFGQYCQINLQDSVLFSATL